MQNNCREKFILWLVSFFILTTAGLAQKSDPPGRALILYDGLSTGYSEGLISANSIANLLGHFSVSYQIQPVESYQKAAMENYSWIFFAGNVEKTQIPRSFLEDLLVTAHNDARRKAELAVQEKMQALTGGLGLPPGLGLT